MKVLALSGGIGGAKLALGLYKTLEADALTVVANPGDDFEHLGFTICPDLDTVTYTLADVVNAQTGWGLKDETWNFMQQLKQGGGEDWFALGDKDLELHKMRTRRLAEGDPLTRIALEFSRSLGITATLLPASNERVRTVVQTDDGDLDFQHYFVREHAQPVVTGFEFSGAAHATIPTEVTSALDDSDLSMIVICPSNPYISIDPILAIPGYRAALTEAGVPVVAVSPVVGGKAVKGPTAKMMDELGIEVSAMSVAEHYADILDGFVIDEVDAQFAGAIENKTGLSTCVVNTMMTSLETKKQLARDVIDFAAGLKSRT